MSNKKTLRTTGNGNPVFENRNKAYGAYQLRRSYEKRLTIGLISTVSFFILALWGMGKITPGTMIDEIVRGGGGVSGPKVDTTEIVLMNPDELDIQTDHPKADPNTIPEVTPRVVDNVDTIQHKPTGDKMAMASVGGQGGSGLGDPGSIGTIPNPFAGGKAPLIKRPNIDEPYRQTYDVAPSYPGGTEAYQRYVNDHVNSSIAEMTDGASGKIVLNLSIDEEGNVTNVEVIKGINSIYDREIVRVLKTTKWNPATTDGRPIRVKCGTTILVHM